MAWAGVFVHVVGKLLSNLSACSAPLSSACACFAPATQSALIEVKAVSTLSRYMHRLATKVREEPDAVQVVGLVLETLTKFFNPDISLNPLASR